MIKKREENQDVMRKIAQSILRPRNETHEKTIKKHMDRGVQIELDDKQRIDALLPNSLIPPLMKQVCLLHR